MDDASFWLDLLKFGLPSGFIFSFFTWLVSLKKRKNDFISDLQKSIDLLSAKYKESVEENLKLMERNTTLYADNLQLSSDKSLLLANQEKMARKIEMLSRKIDELTKQLKAKNDGKINQPAPYSAPSGRSPDGMRYPKEDGIEIIRAGAVCEPVQPRGKRRTRQPHRAQGAANDGELYDIDGAIGGGGNTEAGGIVNHSDRQPP